MAKRNKEKTIQTQKEEESIEMNFSPIKKLFSKKEKKSDLTKKEAEKSNEETVDISFDSINKGFLKKAGIVLLLLIPIIIALYLRSFPANLPIAEDWARSSIHNNIRASIASQVNQQFPNLPDANKNALIEKQLNEYIKANQAQIDEGVKNGAEYLRSQFQDENGYTYLADIDSYFYMRQARNLIEKGTICDKIENNQCIDDHMLAPVGSGIGESLHPYAIAYTYKIMHAFNPKITLMRATFYLPYILSILTIIVAFFAAREIAGDLGGFFAGLVIAVQPFFLSRTYGADTDVWNVFFPILVAFFVLKAMDSKDLKKRIIYAILGGVSASLFAFAWSGWWYIFDFLIGALVIYMIIDTVWNAKYLSNIKTFFEKTLVKETATVIIIFGVTTAILTAFVFKNVLAIWNTAILGPLDFLFIKHAAHLDFFPNVYTTVAELNPGNINTVIASVGGTGLFIISIIGIFFTLFRKDIKGRINLNFFILMLLWYAGTIYATMKGVRFTLLLISAFALGFGIALGIFYQVVSNWITKELEVKEWLSKTLIIIVMLSLFWVFGPVKDAQAASKNELPIINDGWYNTLTKINDEAAKDAIITSWWDFGHHFKYLADRKVTFDGASQTGYNAHWVGKMLLTNDEDLSVGLLRMVDCSGGSNAYEAINEKLNDTHRSVELLNKAVILNRNQALSLYEKELGKEQANKVIELTHCTPPEAYFITSEDMIGKAGVWAHFGSWDFRKAEIWISYKDLPRDAFITQLLTMDYNESEATKIYYEVQSITDENTANTWISPWPSYLSGETYCQKGANETIICQNGLMIDLTNYNATIPTSEGVLSPKSISYLNKEGEFVYDINTKGKVLTTQDGAYIGATILKRGENDYRTVLMSDSLTASMFTRLFFHEGVGLNHFEKFSDITDVTGQRIIVWKINWEGKQ